MLPGTISTNWRVISTSRPSERGDFALRFRVQYHLELLVVGKFLGSSAIRNYAFVRCSDAGTGLYDTHKLLHGVRFRHYGVPFFDNVRF